MKIMATALAVKIASTIQAKTSRVEIRPSVSELLLADY